MPLKLTTVFYFTLSNIETLSGIVLSTWYARLEWLERGRWNKQLICHLYDEGGLFTPTDPKGYIFIVQSWTIRSI